VNISQYVVFSVLLFIPGIVKDYSGARLVAVKMAALIFGSVSGLNLYQVLAEMISIKEKLIHVSQIIFLVFLVSIITNI